jgi:predicted O-methyltransferase YrrM
MDQPYDLVFIDADKEGYAGYLTQLLHRSQPGQTTRLLRPGALILVDNVLQSGDVADRESDAARAPDRLSRIEVVRAFNEKFLTEPRLQTFMLPLWDGLSVMKLID